MPKNISNPFISLIKIRWNFLEKCWVPTKTQQRDLHVLSTEILRQLEFWLIYNISCLSQHNGRASDVPHLGPIPNHGHSPTRLYSPIMSWAWMGAVISDGSLRPCLLADKTRKTYCFPSARSKTAYRGDRTAVWALTRCQVPLPTTDCKETQDLHEEAKNSPTAWWRKHSALASQTNLQGCPGSEAYPGPSINRFWILWKRKPVWKSR